MNETETWKTIYDFPHYEVSDRSRIKSIDRILYFRNDGIATHLKGKIKKQGITRGYFVTRLFDGSGKGKLSYVHIFIAKAFVPNPENKPYVNHKDGNKLNNAVPNLEWCTSSENNQHAIDNGLRGYNTGVSHCFAVFTEPDVLNIKELYKSGHTIAEITRIYKRSRGSIDRIAKGLSYVNAENIILAK